MDAIFIGTRIELCFARPQARGKNKQNEICMKVTIFRTKQETESGFPFEDSNLFFIVIRPTAVCQTIWHVFKGNLLGQTS